MQLLGTLFYAAVCGWKQVKPEIYDEIWILQRALYIYECGNNPVNHLHVGVKGAQNPNCVWAAVAQLLYKQPSHIAKSFMVMIEFTSPLKEACHNTI